MRFQIVVRFFTPNHGTRCQRQHAYSHFQHIFPSSNRDKKFMNETHILQIEFITPRVFYELHVE